MDITYEIMQNFFKIKLSQLNLKKFLELQTSKKSSSLYKKSF